MKAVVVLLVALLAALCLAETVQAALPAGAMADCDARLCDGPIGCGAPAQVQAFYPSPTTLATIPAPAAGLAAPPQATDPVAGASPDAGTSRPVVPLGPRSPPDTP